MQIIIYDTEFTAWEGSLKRNWGHEWEAKELIQVSAIKLKIGHQNIEEVETINLFIRPQKNPTLSCYIKDLTGITQEDIKQGLSPKHFFEAFYQFTEQGNIPIASWGNDFHILKETASINRLSVDWVNSYNLMEIFRSFGINTQVNSGYLYKQFNLNLDLHEHNALDDTISLVESLKCLYTKDRQTVIDYVIKLQESSSNT